jgi:hypothetical protein
MGTSIISLRGAFGHRRPVRCPVEFIYIKRVFAIPTKAVMQLDQVLEERDRKRTTPIKVTFIRQAITSTERRHTRRELNTRPTSIRQATKSSV